MGTLRIMFELDTDAIAGHEYAYVARVVKQFAVSADIGSMRGPHPSLSPAVEGRAWLSRPLHVRRTPAAPLHVGHVYVDRSETGWDHVR